MVHGSTSALIATFVAERLVGGSPPCSVRVSVKASAILYDVKTAVLQRFWWKYCDLLLVEVPPPGRVDGFTPCDVWSELGERTEDTANAVVRAADQVHRAAEINRTTPCVIT